MACNQLIACSCFFVCCFQWRESVRLITVWCHKAQIDDDFSQRPNSAFMTLCNAQWLHLFIVILHCADFMAAAATCPLMFSTFSTPHPMAWQNWGCIVCQKPVCGHESYGFFFQQLILLESMLPLVDYKENSKIFNPYFALKIVSNSPLHCTFIPISCRDKSDVCREGQDILINE